MRYVFILLGAFLNRIRGGLFDIPLNKIYFPIYLSILAYFYYNLNIEGLVSVFLAGYIGQQIIGWGAYIGSLTVGAKPSVENEMIDEIINALRITIDGRTYHVINAPRVWGFCGLFLRGLVWTIPLGLAVNSLKVMLCGGLMPVCYLIPTIILYKTKYAKTKTAWNIGEYLWGACLTAFMIF